MSYTPKFVCQYALAGMVALCVCGLAVNAQAQLADGKILGIGFGPVVPGNNYNQIKSNDGNGIFAGDYGPFIDTTGSTVSGVGMTFGGTVVSNFDNNGGSSHDVANYPAQLNVPAGAVSNLTGASPGVGELTFTFTGLNDSLDYNVYGFSAYMPLNAQNQPLDGERPQLWTVNGHSGTTWSRAGNTLGLSTGGLPGSTVAQLTYMQTDGAGNLVVHLQSIPLGLPIFNALAIQAVTPSGVAGDINNDGSVTLSDYDILRSHWLQNSGFGLGYGDLDDNGVVTFLDFAMFRQAYEDFNGPGSGSALAPIPEPASLVLLVAALPCLVLLRARRAGRHTE